MATSSTRRSPTPKAGSIRAEGEAPTKALIEELYLVTLSRSPRPEEVSKANEWIASARTTREGLQDLLWTLINSREFLFNH